MSALFDFVFRILVWVSVHTGLSYNEVNIVVYYILLPFVYVMLADRIWRKNVLKIGYVVWVVVLLFLIPDFSAFSDWLFQVSVNFLLFFQVIGWSYVVASVILCVLVPLVILIWMLHIAYPRLFSTLRRKMRGSLN